MSTPWQIQLLGELRFQRGTVQLGRLSKRKTEALLAYLALQPGRAFAREVLAAQFWADTRDEAHSLRMALSELRKVLGEALVTDNRTVQLDPELVRTDVLRFDSAFRLGQWETAVQLYTGPLLPGFYDDWVLAQQVRLADLYGLAASRWVEAASTLAELRTRLTTALTKAPEHPELLSLRDRLAQHPPAQRAPSLPPRRLTTFIGRDTEKQWLRTHLAPQGSMGLITLTGPPGSGKTRLALELLPELAPLYPEALWFVSLRGLAPTQSLWGTLHRALGLAESATVSPREAVLAALRMTPACLLVIDNAEQHREAVGALCTTLLHHLPQLTCLVTSRRRLDSEGEQELPLQPLPLSDALQLFESRVRQARPTFQLTTENRASVGELCQRLDCLPLALELAAPRLALLSPHQLLARIDSRLDFNSPRQPDHHASLRAAIQSSYELLTPDQQALFAQLSLFRSGWSLTDVTAVVDVPQVVENLEILLSQSLLVSLSPPDATTPRFGLLETLHAFASEQLTPSERHRLQQRHAQHFFALATQTRPLLERTSGDPSDPWIASEANFQAALDTLRRHFPHQALELAAALGPWWLSRGLLSEGLQQLEESLLAAPDAPAPLRGAALASLGALAEDRGELARAEESLGAALPLAPPDSPYYGWALHSLSTTLIRLARYESASVLSHQALALWQAHGNTQGQGAALHNLAQIARHRGHLPQAAEQAHAAQRLLQGWWRWLVIVTLGSIRSRQGRSSEAQAHLTAAIDYYRAIRSPLRCAQALRYRAQASLAVEDIHAAQTDLAEAEELYGRLGSLRGVMLTRLLQAECDLAKGDSPAAAARVATCLLPDTRADDADLLLLAGRIQLAQGEPGAAQTLRRALHGYTQQGLLLGAVETLEALADAAPERKAAWWAAAQQKRHQLGAPLPRLYQKHAPRTEPTTSLTWETALEEALALV